MKWRHSLCCFVVLGKMYPGVELLLTTLPSCYIVLDPEVDYLSVLDEVTSVVEWFTLGLYLKLPRYKLEIIAADYHFSIEARSKMLHVWLQTGNATWSSLFGALIKLGMRDVGKNIAKRRGW